MPKLRFRAAMFIVIAVVVTACEEGRVQQTDPEQQGSGVTGAFRSEEKGAVRSGVDPALVEAGNFNALSQTNLSAVCTTRESRSPDGSMRIGNFIPGGNARSDRRKRIERLRELLPGARRESA